MDVNVIVIGVGVAALAGLVAVISYAVGGRKKLVEPQGFVDPVELERAILRCAWSDALEIVSFAVANLDPATVRGWPVGALERLVEVVKQLDVEPRTDAEGLWHAYRGFLKGAIEFHKWRRGEGPQPGGYVAPPSTLEANAKEQAEVAALTQVLRDTGRLASPHKP